MCQRSAALTKADCLCNGWYGEEPHWGPALSSEVRRCLVASLCKITKDIICFLYLAFQDLDGRLLVNKTFVAQSRSEHKGSYLKPIWPASV